MSGSELNIEFLKILIKHEGNNISANISASISALIHNLDARKREAHANLFTYIINLIEKESPYSSGMLNLLSSIENFFLQYPEKNDWMGDSSLRGKTFLHQAARFNRLEVAKFLLEKYPKLISICDLDGRTPLHEAARHDSAKVAVFIIGLNPTLTNQKSTLTYRTALHEAVLAEKLDMVNLLLDNNALIDIQDKEGMTPLSLACTYLNKAIIQTIISRGGNPDLKNHFGKDCYDLMKSAAWNGEEFCLIVRQQLSKVKIEEKSRKAMAAWMKGINSDLRLNENKRGLSPVSNFHLGDKLANDMLEKIRVRNYVAGEDVFFDATDGTKYIYPHSEVFLALVFASSINCELFDIEDMLISYEKNRISGGIIHAVHPLYFLAHVRLEKKKNNLILVYGLLSKFCSLCEKPLWASWLIPSEINLLDNPGQISEPSTPSQMSPVTTESKWDQLKKLLKPSQIEPMEKLMALVGLEEVKKIALQIYSGVLADKRLKENGFSKSVCEPALNFLFVGNPGTGKIIFFSLIFFTIKTKINLI